MVVLGQEQVCVSLDKLNQSHSLRPTSTCHLFIVLLVDDAIPSPSSAAISILSVFYNAAEGLITFGAESSSRPRLLVRRRGHLR